MIIRNDDSRYQGLLRTAAKGIKMLVGEEFYFYGVFQNQFKIDDMVLEVLEDPQDGYRSSMGTICHTEKTNGSKHFHKLPLSRVIFEIDDTDDDGLNYQLRDVETNHIWLKFGTGNTSDYYPYFVFRYTPDEGQKEYTKIVDGYVSFKEKYPEKVLVLIDWFSFSIDDMEGY